VLSGGNSALEEWYSEDLKGRSSPEEVVNAKEIRKVSPLI